MASKFAPATPDEFSSSDLAYALEVNRLANSLQRDALIEKFGDLEKADPDAVKAWYASNHFDNYVIRVLEVSYGTARFIKRFQNGEDLAV